MGEPRAHVRRIVPPQGDHRQKQIRFEPQERLEEIVRGEPCVVCGFHLGNWELVASAIKLMGALFTGVYQRLNNPIVDEETRKLRTFLYEGGLLPKTPMSARGLMKTAKSGGYPAFLAGAFDRFSRSFARKAGLPLYAGAAFLMTARLGRDGIEGTCDAGFLQESD